MLKNASVPIAVKSLLKCLFSVNSVPLWFIHINELTDNPANARATACHSPWLAAVGRES